MELWEYVDAFDPMDDYIEKIMEQMMATVESGLSKEGVLPGDLHLERIAKELKVRQIHAKVRLKRKTSIICIRICCQ